MSPNQSGVPTLTTLFEKAIPFPMLLITLHFPHRSIPFSHTM